MENKRLVPDLSRAGDNSIYRNLLSRRDTKDFNGEPVANELIRELLYAASWAPNHKLLEPWRFAVVTTSGRERFLAELTQSILEMVGQKKGEDEARNTADKAIPKFSRAGAFVAVASCRHEDETLDQENLIATSCAVQNMLLLATSQGVHCHWGSSAHLIGPRMKRYFGFDEDTQMLGVIWLGYVNQVKESKRTPVESFTNWLED